MENNGGGSDHERGDLNLYGKEYAEVQGRGIAKEYLDFFDKKFVNTKDKTVIELGSGSGALMPFLKERFAHAFGIDLNKYMLLSNEDKTGLAVGDLQDLPIAANSVDEVVTLHTLEHSPDLGIAMHEIERILKPGGEAIIVVPKPQLNIRQLGALVDTLKMYTGSAKLNEVWNEAVGVRKVAAVLGQYKKAWDVAGKLHVQNVTEEKIKKTGSGMTIKEVKKLYVPEEMGTAWVITMKNEK